VRAVPRPRPIHVRPLTAGDRAAWQPLWDGYLRFYRAELDDAVTDRTFERLCAAADPELHGLLALDGDGAAGLAHLVFHPSTWSARPRCYLEDLFVARDRRGAGIGEALFEAIYAHAREQGAADVYWHTQQFNGPARSLYDTVGRLTSFVVYERDLAGGG
jgi:GNAT superfamily N-acetyltransferase